MDIENIKIVPACREHIDDILIIEKLSFAIPWSRQSITEEILENSIAVYFCALAGDKTVGFAGMWKVVDEGHITNIVVHPEFRGIGIGGALIERLLDVARMQDITALTLEVKRNNRPARSLYKKYGFKMAGVRTGYYPEDNEDAIIMWKQMNKS